MNEHLWAKKIDKVIFKSLWGVSVLSGISLVIVALICTIDALGAKIFSHSVPNGTEWVTFLNIPVVFFAMGFIQVERGHTVVDILYGKFPKILRKIITLFGDVIGMLICAALAYFEIVLTIDKFGAGTRASSSSTSFMVWPFALVVAIGFLTVAIAFAWSIFREIFIPIDQRMGALPQVEEQMKEQAKAELENFGKLMEGEVDKR